MMDDIDETKLSEPILERRKFVPLVRELSRTNSLRFLVEIIFQWAIIAGLLGAAVYLDHWWAYLIVIPPIATRQHALGVLLHETAHYQWLSNKRANDVLSDIFLALPLGVLTSAFRQQHFLHHRYVGSEQDPEFIVEEAGITDWEWPKSKHNAYRSFLGDIAGLHLVSVAGLLFQWSPWARILGLHRIMNKFYISQVPWKDITKTELLVSLSWGAGLAAFLTLTQSWLLFLLLWVLPALSIFHAIFKFRSLCEHINAPKGHELNTSRSIEAKWWEKILIAPCNVQYHLEHHLFPSVPFFNLEKLHQALLKDATFRQHAAYCPHGYFGGKGAWSQITFAPEEELPPCNVVPMAIHKANFDLYAT